MKPRISLIAFMMSHCRSTLLRSKAK